MSKIVWQINGLTGEQDSPYLGQQGGFQSACGVDIRKEPPFIKLSSAMSLEWTYDDEIILIKNLEDFGLTGILVCLANGKIYINNTLKDTLSGVSGQIKGVGYMGTSLYFFSNTTTGTGSIYKSDSTISAGLTLLTTFSVGTGSVFVYEYPIISEATRLIVGVRNKVFEIDFADTLSYKLELPERETIKGITEFQNNYKIYSSVIYSDTGISGRQYNWDGLSTEYDYVINWNNLPFLGIGQKGAYDYAITGFNSFYSDLYQVAGSQRVDLRVNLELIGRRFNGNISTRSDILYLTGANKEGIYGIYSYGSYYPGFGDGLVMEYALGTTPLADSFSYLVHTNAKTYIACDNYKVYSISYTPSIYFNNGYLITKKWTGNGLHTLKSIDYMYVGYKLESGTSIKIYASNGNGTFKLLKTITDTSKKGLRIEANEFASLDLGDFYELEFKFELVTTDTSKTPALGEVLVFCNDEYNK